MTAGQGFGLGETPKRDRVRELAEHAALTARKPVVVEGADAVSSDAAGPGTAVGPIRPAAEIRPQKQAPPPRRTTAPHGSAAR